MAPIFKFMHIFVICNSPNKSDLDNFFFKLVRILPQVHKSCQLTDLVCHLVKNQKKVIISEKISCQIWSNIFSGTHRGPWQYVVYHFSGLWLCHSDPFRRGVKVWKYVSQSLFSILCLLSCLGNNSLSCSCLKHCFANFRHIFCLLISMESILSTLSASWVQLSIGQVQEPTVATFCHWELLYNY